MFSLFGWYGVVKVRYVATAATFHLGVERGGRGGSLRTKKWSWNYDNEVNFCTPGLHSHMVQ